MFSIREAQLARYGRCPVKDCTEPATEGHHVLYKHLHGRDVIKNLCPEHHRWITRAHAHAGRRQRHELSISQRWRFWYLLVNGEMKRPRETHLDRDWRNHGRGEAPVGPTLDEARKEIATLDSRRTTKKIMRDFQKDWEAACAKP